MNESQSLNSIKGKVDSPRPKQRLASIQNLNDEKKGVRGGMENEPK
jgi:hypothetical protein